MPPVIESAAAADLPAIRAIVEEAYAPYVPRIGRRPGPMDDDYCALVAAGRVRVLREAKVIGVLVLVPQDDALLIDNVALAAAGRGRGLGRLLMDHAEAEARALSLPRLRLYTHVLMTENRALYARLGYAEVRFVTERGLERVYVEKPL